MLSEGNGYFYPQFLFTAEEEQHLSAIRAVMARRGKLKQTILHCILFGYPGTGKSSLLKWITGQRLSPHLPSTGVAEKAVLVEIRKLTTFTAMALRSKSQYASLWRILSIDDEALALIASADRDISTSDEPVTAMCSPRFTLASAETDTTGDSSHVTIQSQPMDVLKKAIEKGGLVGIQQFLQDSLTLFLTDTGGQLEFQELLPALTAGPIIFFLVFRLDQDLNKTFTVEYRPTDGDSMKLYQSSLTVKETLQQALASISSMGTHMDKHNKELSEDVLLKPSVILIGTHRDKVSPEEIQRIDHSLREMAKAASFPLDLIEPASESQFVVAVNNLSPNDSDLRCIQSVVERIADRKNYEVGLPSTWLIFSLLIRQQKSRIITYDDCYDIAQECGIDSHEELNEALWFLNTKVGLVRYFQGEGLEDLQQIVIIDPQIIFDKLTRLIVNTFTLRNLDPKVCAEFNSTGIFSRSDVERIWSRDDAEDELLTVNRFLKLLEHLHIISHFQPHDTSKREFKYFMPCTLVHAQSMVCDSTHSATASFAGTTQQVSPLLFTFKCGYCPIGLFSALVAYLLANKMKSHFHWTLKPNCISRNEISLLVPPYDTIKLMLLPTYLEVAMFPAHVRRERMITVSEVCVEVRRCIEIAVREVASTLHYTSDAEHSLAFYCPGEHEAKHPAEVVYLRGNPCTVQCKLCGFHDLPQGYEHWFIGEGSSSLCTQTLQTPLSIEEYVAKIKQDVEISDDIQIADIAENIVEWELVLDLLGISAAEAKEIKKDNLEYLEQK